MAGFVIIIAGLVVACGFSVLLGAEHADPVLAFEARVKSLFAPWFTPSAGAHVVPPAQVGTSDRRTPSRVENEAAAGGAPGADGTWSSPQAPGAVRIDVQARFDEALARQPLEHGELRDTPADGIEVARPDGVLTIGEHPVTRRRPVNGRSLPDQPRQGKQPWLTAEMPAVPVAEIRGPERPWDPGDGIDPPVPLARPYVFGEAPVARVLGLADLGPGDAEGRTLAERMMP